METLALTLMFAACDLAPRPADTSPGDGSAPEDIADTAPPRLEPPTEPARDGRIQPGHGLECPYGGGQSWPAICVNPDEADVSFDDGINVGDIGDVNGDGVADALAVEYSSYGPWLDYWEGPLGGVLGWHNLTCTIDLHPGDGDNEVHLAILGPDRIALAHYEGYALWDGMLDVFGAPVVSAHSHRCDVPYLGGQVGGILGELGTGLRSAGDSSGDGEPDVVVFEGGRYGGTFHGLYAPSDRSWGVASDLGVGFSDAYSPGDLDGDGIDELVIEAHWLGLLRGPLGAETDASAEAEWLVVEGYDEIEDAVAGADFDGDGYGDIALGAYRDSAPGTERSRSWVLAGPVDAVDTGAAVAVLLDYRQVKALSTAGDLTDDGLPDLVVLDSTGGVKVVPGPYEGTLITDQYCPDVGLTGYISPKPSGQVSDLDGDGNTDLALIRESDWGPEDGALGFLGPFTSATFSLVGAE